MFSVCPSQIATKKRTVKTGDTNITTDLTHKTHHQSVAFTTNSSFTTAVAAVVLNVLSRRTLLEVALDTFIVAVYSKQYK